MKEALVQTFVNLRANKLRSFLTMFGILWGIISVVVLSATGEGFRQGNEHVLRELGKNIGDYVGWAHQQAGWAASAPGARSSSPPTTPTRFSSRRDSWRWRRRSCSAAA